jgi:hypothetical protein
MLQPLIIASYERLHMASGFGRKPILEKCKWTLGFHCHGIYSPAKWLNKESSPRSQWKGRLHTSKQTKQRKEQRERTETANKEGKEKETGKFVLLSATEGLHYTAYNGVRLGPALVELQTVPGTHESDEMPTDILHWPWHFQQPLRMEVTAMETVFMNGKCRFHVPRRLQITENMYMFYLYLLVKYYLKDTFRRKRASFLVHVSSC